MAAQPDLLDDVAGAQVWLDAALAIWGTQTGRVQPAITLSPDDLGALRDLRGLARDWLAGHADSAAHRVEVGIARVDGRADYQPRGDGAAAVVSLVMLELLLASHNGAMGRLKICANPECRAAFYDLSRNVTRVWHDKEICGNAINLRASRARRRELPVRPDSPGPGSRAGATGHRRPQPDVNAHDA